MELIADTTFLIGLWRKQDWAISYATANSGKSIGLSWVVLGEFWNGSIRAGHDPARVTKFLEIGMPINDAGQFVGAYAKICTELQQNGHYRQIGQNDLWIAAVAKKLNRPLVTRNVRHFDKIEKLQLELLDQTL